MADTTRNIMIQIEMQQTMVLVLQRTRNLVMLRWYFFFLKMTAKKCTKMNNALSEILLGLLNLLFRDVFFVVARVGYD